MHVIAFLSTEICKDFLHILLVNVSRKGNYEEKALRLYDYRAFGTDVRIRS